MNNKNENSGKIVIIHSGRRVGRTKLHKELMAENTKKEAAKGLIKKQS